MQRDRIQRLLPLTGVFFAAVMLSALYLTRGEADAGASPQAIFDYWHDHHGVQLVAALVLAPYGAALLVLFATALRGTIRAHETEAALCSPIVLAGGIIAAVGLTFTGVLDAAVATSADHGARDAVYTLAQLQSYDWVPWVVGFGVMLLATGIGGLRTLTLPRPLSWSAVVLGVLFLTPAGFLAAFALPVWTIATGIVLYRRNCGARSISVAAEAT
jgi:hypothetical protein